MLSDRRCILTMTALVVLWQVQNIPEQQIT